MQQTEASGLPEAPPVVRITWGPAAPDVLYANLSRIRRVPGFEILRADTAGLIIQKPTELAPGKAVRAAAEWAASALPAAGEPKIECLVDPTEQRSFENPAVIRHRHPLCLTCSQRHSPLGGMSCKAFVPHSDDDAAAAEHFALDAFRGGARAGLMLAAEYLARQGSAEARDSAMRVAIARVNATNDPGIVAATRVLAAPYFAEAG